MYSKGGKVTRYLIFSNYYIILYNRNRKGHIIKPAPFQAGVKSGEVARIQPNSKWFGKS